MSSKSLDVFDGVNSLIAHVLGKMTYYLRSLPNSPAPEVWHIAADEAIKLGVDNPQSFPGAYFKAAPGETIWDTIRNITPWFGPNDENPFHEARLAPGKYFPRMARPHLHWPHPPGLNPGTGRELNSVAIYHSQLTVLTRQLIAFAKLFIPVGKHLRLSVTTFEIY
jgi:hypothetical protein